MAEQVSSSVVGKVVDSLFGVVKKEIGYMWYCSQNVETFKRALRDLKDMRDRVQQQIGIAKDKGNNLVSGVENWVVEADEEISKAAVFLQQEADAKKTCFKIGMCGNWATLHHYGKIATKMTSSLSQHQASGTPYEGGVSVYTRPPGPLDVFENKDLDGIDTHNSALGDIVIALEDENKQIIGIYGLGGVGKTTLAMEVAARVKTNLFADVALITVSQTVDVDKIKNDTENAAKRIMNGDNILIILDDVWEKLNLQELCIPCGSKHKNCKILLTSRSESVCEKMNAQSKICVNSLPTKEAWILFKRVVGERAETDADLKPVAEEVAKECGGLPLLIQVVGSTLKNKSISSWKSALSRLKKPAPSEIDPDIRKAFTRLQLSYDYLESEEAKSCFLLCSMFPEDHSISLEDLVYYAVGLSKFDDLESMEDARDRLRIAVNMLTSSCLLLNSQREGYTKMHDVVRDVALLIASEGKNKYLVRAGKGLTEWLPRDNNLKSYTGISLMYNKISKLPDYEVHLSNLDIFLVNYNWECPVIISDKFIEGMKEVKVLDMGSCWKAQLPQSLKLLTKLRMLNLEANEHFHEISLLGEMKELEILILNKTGIKEVPQEIGQLVNLRRLEVSECANLLHMAAGVISRLQRLEELCIDFRKMSEGVSDCIVEVMKLSKLTYLELMLNSIDHIPEGFNSENLKGFFIQIGGVYPFYSKSLKTTLNSERYLHIDNDYLVIPLVKRLKKLIEGSRPITHLEGIENLSNILPTLYNEGFNKLEHIELYNCPNVSCLVDDGTRCDGDEGKTEEKYLMELKHLRLVYVDELEVIWKCPDEHVSLTNLVTLEVVNCKKLERVFTVRVAQGLVNLKYLYISDCKGIEEVIYGGGEGGEEIEQQHSSSAANTIIIVFPCLELIQFYRLESLKSFFNSGGNGNCIIKYPSLEKLEITYCESMKKWGPGIHETPHLKTLVWDGEPTIDDEQLVLDGPLAINDAVEKLWRWDQGNLPSHDESNNDDDE